MIFHGRWISGLACWFLLGSTGGQADDSSLSLADLDAYRVALTAIPDASAPSVQFGDLWERPEAFLGRTVSIDARVARFFRQPRLGEFPPLVEAWVVSSSGDPFCLVYPLADGKTTPEIGASIRFSGTFLKRIKYNATDTARLAPVIIGPEPPSIVENASTLQEMSWSSVDWLMAVAACLVVGLVLVRRHLARPASISKSLDPPPIFVDHDPGSNLDGDRVEEEDYRETQG